jgi:pimeloyl-ACP methyl ester carboxylesterase
MKSILIISGWAHGIEAIRPMGDALVDQFDVQLMTGNQVLKEQRIPDADFIITGSMGGLLAIELLPACCRKLVLISSTAKFCSGEDYPCGTHEKILKRMLLMLKRNPDAVLADFYKNVHAPNPALKTDPECELDDLVAGLEYLLHSDVRSNVPTLGIPVQLFHGSEDRIIPLGATEWLHETLPDSRLTVYSDGHGLPAHHFSEMMNEICRFLKTGTENE